MAMSIVFHLAIYAVVAFLWWDNGSLRKENAKKDEQISQIKSANEMLSLAIKKQEDELNATIATLEIAKNKKEIEVRYVEKIKYQIIKDKNASCIGSVNAVFARLFEQTRDQNSTNRTR